MEATVEVVDEVIEEGIQSEVLSADELLCLLLPDPQLSRRPALLERC